MIKGIFLYSISGATAGVGLLAAASSPVYAVSSDRVLAQAEEVWRDAIARVATPSGGCFTAEYPNKSWRAIACVKAPDIRYPRSDVNSIAVPQTVGAKNDYVAETLSFMSGAVGSFPVVSGVTGEKDNGRPNVYSIQLNSNFMSTAACNGVAGCLSWEQFIYSSSGQSAFMQYWLLNYGRRCPTGWGQSSRSCVMNSAAVSVPKLAINNLSKLKLSGTAIANGNDTLVFIVGTKAYSISASDSVVDLATAWNESEFNIFGDGDKTQASFNSGSLITVKINVTDGTSDAPICAADSGTTGETNNLTLGTCSAVGGTSPYIEFSESNGSVPTETVLHSFGDGADGTTPVGGLILASDGNYYGTTQAGGSSNAGSVFRITPVGEETVLYSFKGGTDGYLPDAGLLQGSDGNFYGTTQNGGANGLGTVFVVNASGVKILLHSFSGSPDGAAPGYGTLIAGSDNALYGTTLTGGVYNCGSVFKITPAGVESVLYSFGCGVTDGSTPLGGLVLGSDGNFYGTTVDGGSAGHGVIYRVTPNGAETMLYSFGGSPDGSNSISSLVQGSDGNFYGTSNGGGASNHGTVFRVTPSGAESVLYSFSGNPDGAGPYAGALVEASDGNFYGTTSGGGASNNGTVFRVTTSGAETTLYSFGGDTDAAVPFSGLVEAADGSFYGTTGYGGQANLGAVFKLVLSGIEPTLDEAPLAPGFTLTKDKDGN